MRLHWHFLVNIILVIIGKIVFNIEENLLIFFVIVGGAIDVDHPLYTMIKHKTFSSKKIVKIEQAAWGKMQARMYVFHSPEFNTLLIIFSFFSVYSLVFLTSNVIHLSLDAIKHHSLHKNLEGLKNWSIIYNLKN